ISGLQAGTRRSAYPYMRKSQNLGHILTIATSGSAWQSPAGFPCSSGVSMKSHVRVAVIGGGGVGVSVLYHLTKLGWTDVALIERSELTSGSTWHAAGGMHTINGDTNMSALQAYTVRLYDELERESGQACGIHRVGCLYLAADETCMDYFRLERG